MCKQCREIEIRDDWEICRPCALLIELQQTTDFAQILAITREMFKAIPGMRTRHLNSILETNRRTESTDLRTLIDATYRRLAPLMRRIGARLELPVATTESLISEIFMRYMTNHTEMDRLVDNLDRYLITTFWNTAQKSKASA